MTVETITSRRSALLTHLRKLASSRAYRDECGEYLGDGVKLLGEAQEDRANVRKAEIQAACRTEAGRTCPNPKCICHTEQELPAYFRNLGGVDRCLWCDSEM